MTQIVPGVVEVYVIRHNGGDWRVLVLQRAADASRPASWELVYGKIDAGERPEGAAVRELREETGLEVGALYNVTVNSFYLHTTQTIQMSIVFAAFVSDDAQVTHRRGASAIRVAQRRRGVRSLHLAPRRARAKGCAPPSGSR